MDLDLWDCLGRVKLMTDLTMTDFLIFSHSREGKILSYSRINMVTVPGAGLETY